MFLATTHFCATFHVDANATSLGIGSQTQSFTLRCYESRRMICKLDHNINGSVDRSLTSVESIGLFTISSTYNRVEFQLI